MKPQYYIDFLNSARGFKRDRKEFATYEEARRWCLDNMMKFDPDYIKTI